MFPDSPDRQDSKDRARLARTTFCLVSVCQSARPSGLHTLCLSWLMRKRKVVWIRARGARGTIKSHQLYVSHHRSFWYLPWNLCGFKGTISKMFKIFCNVKTLHDGKFPQDYLKLGKYWGIFARDFQNLLTKIHLEMWWPFWPEDLADWSSPGVLKSSVQC